MEVPEEEDGKAKLAELLRKYNVSLLEYARSMK